MKRIIAVILVFTLIFFACTTGKVFVTQDIDVPEALEHKISVLPPYIQEEEATAKSLIEIDYIIDDFENGIDKWSAQASRMSYVSMIEDYFDGEGKSIKATYNIRQKKQVGINPDYISFKIRKNTKFERFKGVEFIARASHLTTMKVLLYEYNQVTDKLAAQEIWFKEITLYKNWKKFHFIFSAFTSEEYFEQGFIGDQNQQLQNIREVGFYIDNRQDLDEKTGDIYIDNIYLF